MDYSHILGSAGSQHSPDIQHLYDSDNSSDLHSSFRNVSLRSCQPSFPFFLFFFDGPLCHATYLPDANN